MLARATPEISYEQVKNSAQNAFDEKGVWILAAGSVATVIAFQFDQQVRNGAKDHQSMSPSVTKIGEFWGGGIPEVLVFSTQYFYDRDKSIAGFEGLIMGGLVVQGLKYSVHRERPDGSENVSFPSGHTQAAFSLAMSMTDSYGWQTGLPFWAMGVFTGMTRISDDKHWFSDVVAGATIGILFGRAGFQQNGITPVVAVNNGQVNGLEMNYRVEF